MFWHAPWFRMWHLIVGVVVLLAIVALLGTLLRGGNDSGSQT